MCSLISLSFSCPSCVLLFVASAFGFEPLLQPPNQHVGRWRDPYHRVEKRGPITMSPGGGALDKRAEVCGGGYYACDKSLGGDCCPSNYVCATDSCYAATLNPYTQTACGKAGYFACPYDTDGGTGGCCPVGYICGVVCELPAGASTSCPASYTLCPASMNYGCCKSGYGCGTQICSPTEVTSGTFTRTITTENNAGATTTVETVVTSTWTPTVADTAPTSYINGNQDSSQQVLKYYPSKVAKVAGTGSDDNSDGGGGGGGMPKSTIGGIVGGGVALVVIIILVTIFIHFRLRHNERVMESEKRSSTKKSRTDYMATKTEDDSATQTAAGQCTPRHGRGRTASSSSVGLAGAPGIVPTPDTNGNGSNTFGQPSSGSGYGSYSAVPTGGSEGIRHPSVDSSAGGVSYFDHRVSSQTVPNGYRYSTDSNNAPGSGVGTPYIHARQWSEGSGQGEPYVIVTPQELDSRAFMPELPGSPDLSPGAGGPATSPSVFSPGSSIGGAAGLGVAGGQQLHPPSPGLASGSSPSTPEGSRRRSGSGGMGVASGRPPPTHQTRRRSDSAGHHRGRSDSSAASGGAAALGVVTEQTEGVMHGYYGPAHRQVGQTAVGLRPPLAEGEDAEDGRGGSSRNSFSVERADGKIA